MVSEVSNPASPPHEISHIELLDVVETGSCAVIDVREPHEFAAGHIPGAVNMPLSSFNPGALPDGKPMVLVCQAGARSARALREVFGAGVEDARHYAPGMNGWRMMGGPVTL